MSTTFNLLDLAFIAFTAIFVLTAFFRGFIKEIFSLFNWTVSLVVSHLLAPYLSDFLYSYSDSKIAIDAIVRVSIFIAVFLLVAFSTAGLSKALKEKTPIIFDRSLGVLFGILKTLIIFGTAYAIAVNLFAFALGKGSDDAKQKMPDWLKEAKCRSIIEFSGSVLDPAVKKFFDAITKNFDHVISTTDDIGEKIEEITKEKSSEIIGEAKDIPEKLDSGYNKKDIEKMNRLIEIVQ